MEKGNSLLVMTMLILCMILASLLMFEVSAVDTRIFLFPNPSLPDSKYEMMGVYSPSNITLSFKGKDYILRFGWNILCRDNFSFCTGKLLSPIVNSASNLSFYFFTENNSLNYSLYAYHSPADEDKFYLFDYLNMSPSFSCVTDFNQSYDSNYSDFVNYLNVSFDHCIENALLENKTNKTLDDDQTNLSNFEIVVDDSFYYGDYAIYRINNFGCKGNFSREIRSESYDHKYKDVSIVKTRQFSVKLAPGNYELIVTCSGMMKKEPFSVKYFDDSNYSSLVLNSLYSDNKYIRSDFDFLYALPLNFTFFTPSSVISEIHDFDSPKDKVRIPSSTFLIIIKSGDLERDIVVDLSYIAENYMNSSVEKENLSDGLMIFSYSSLKNFELSFFVGNNSIDVYYDFKRRRIIFHNSFSNTTFSYYNSVNVTGSMSINDVEVFNRIFASLSVHSVPKCSSSTKNVSLSNFSVSESNFSLNKSLSSLNKTDTLVNRSAFFHHQKSVDSFIGSIFSNLLSGYFFIEKHN